MPNEMTAEEAANLLYSLTEWGDFKQHEYVDALFKAIAILRKVAAGELVEVVHARWIKDHEASIFGACSKCGVTGRTDYDYCEGCGALMDADMRNHISDGKDDSHE